MGKILDWLFGSDDQKKPANPAYSSSSTWASGYDPKNAKHSLTAASSTASSLKPIIDPKRITMVKAHTIIGSIEKYGRASEFGNLVTWLETNEASVAKKVLDDKTSHLSSLHLAVRPAAPGGCLAYGPGCFGSLKPNSTVYVLGDTHGDLESLVATLDTILDLAKNKDDFEPTVYLLGDILDRNTDGCLHECVFLLAILQKALPKQFERYNKIKLGIIKGDHDVALSYDSKTKKFKSSVSPADYCDWLNERIDLNKGLEDASWIGRAWIRLMDECPAAAFLEGSGTLLTHGGIPRSDIQEKILSIPYFIQGKECETDFAWCRMVDAKNKLLNRASKTSEVGFQEFEALNNNIFFGKIKKFIFAHQHPARGFQRLDKFYPGYDVMCISSFRADDALGGPTVPYFCKIDSTEVNVYSMSPAAYVVRLEENSIEHSKAASTTVIPTSTPAAKA